MPHAAVMAAAVSLGAVGLVGAAVALEVSVLRPWREENWPDGIAAGLREEFVGMRDEMRQGLWDFRERIHPDGHSHDPRARSPQPPRSRSPPNQLGKPSSSSVQNDENALRRRRNNVRDEQEMRKMHQDMEEFEMHERQRLSDSNISKATDDDDDTFDDSRSRLIDIGISQYDLEFPHHNIGQASPSISYASLDPIDSMPGRIETDFPRSDDGAVSGSADQQGKRAPTTNQSTTSEDEWISRASSPRSDFVDIQSQRSIDAHDDDPNGNISDVPWSNLGDSPPGTPTSGSWTPVDVSSRSGTDSA